MENFLFSLLTSIFWCSFFSFTIHILRKKRYDTRNRNSDLIIFFYLLFFVRIFLPFDIGIAKSVPMPSVFNRIDTVLRLNTYTIFQYHFTLVSVIGLFCFIIGCMKTFHFMFRYFHIQKLLSHFACPDKTAKEMLITIQSAMQLKGEIHLFESNLTQTPISYGILRKNICLPSMAFSEKELYNIFVHELTHFKNRDLLIKFFSKLATCFFWWLPFTYLVSKDLEEFQEIRCDLHATRSMSIQQKISYLSTIQKLVSNTGKRKLSKTADGSLTPLAGDSSPNLLIERFETVIQQEDKQKSIGLPRILIAFIAFFCFISSYFVVFLPFYPPPKAETVPSQDGIIEITPENGYISVTKDGKIYLVSDGYSFEINQEFLDLSEQSGFRILYDSH